MITWVANVPEKKAVLARFDVSPAFLRFEWNEQKSTIWVPQKAGPVRSRQ
jgi:hypothetical protein